jgi:hypothetical protein
MINGRIFGGQCHRLVAVAEDARGPIELHAPIYRRGECGTVRYNFHLPIEAFTFCFKTLNPEPRSDLGIGRPFFRPGRLSGW